MKEKLVYMIDDFIENKTRRLTVDESKKNIENSLIEITDSYGRHSSNGLFISENGYFITAKHCLDDAINNIKISSKNENYELEKKCIFSEYEDLALGKAKIEGNCESKKYNLFNLSDINNMNFFVHLSKWEIEYKVKGINLKNYHNNIIIDKKSNKKFINQFLCSGALIPGDSGGAIVNLHGELMGIASCGGDGLSTGIKIESIIHLLNRYRNWVNRN